MRHESDNWQLAGELREKLKKKNFKIFVELIFYIIYATLQYFTIIS